MEVPKTLVVTNDYPPRVGGIQRTLHALVRQLPPERVTVLAPRWEGSAAFDATEPYRVVRYHSTFMWPTPEVADLVGSVVRQSGIEVVLFGNALPLGLLGPRLARTGTPYLLAAHGVEYWLSLLPGASTMMRRAASRAARIPVMCSAYVARVVRTSVPDRVPVSVLYPGADIERFHPDLPTEDIRSRYGIGDDPLVVCVSRLVERKGQDVLIRALPAIRRRVPGARLLIVGGGRYRQRLEAMANQLPAGSVVFSGEVSEEDLPRHYAVGDVFAMPCRTRRGGFEVEGWGNVFIEAAACGRPVVAGDSGGAPEAVEDGVTGLVVDGRHDGAVAEAVASLLADPHRGAAMGKAGRARVERRLTWPRAAETLARWLHDATG